MGLSNRSAQRWLPVSIYKLHINSQPFAATLYRTFESITNVQLTSDLLEIDRHALVGECGVSADDE